MSSPKLNLLMLRQYLLGDQMSSHDGVLCYPALKRGTEDKYIVKVISIPASQSKVEALLLTGAMSGKEAAMEYFLRLARDVEKQTDILRNLSHQEGFAPYADCHIAPMEGDVGYHVYLLGTYKHSLERIFASDVLTHADVTNLGLDLCAALAACRRTGYLYADLKPGNIFRDPEHGFRIGDVGFIGLSSLKYASLPEKYRSSYTAPEMWDPMAVLNTTVDIYALGLVLYQAYNGGVLPFTGKAPQEILPPPIYADYEMAEIILKACHPDPAQRWEEPTKMAQALIDYLQAYGAPETPIIPPVVEIQPEEESEEEPFLPEVDDDQLQQEIADLENADPDELAFLSGLVSDETAPSEENTVDLPDDVMGEELSQMLAHADELIDHALPAPAVAPDPVFTPMPEPIVLEEEGSEEGASAEETEENCESEEETPKQEAEEAEEPAVVQEPEQPDEPVPAAAEPEKKLSADAEEEEASKSRLPLRVAMVAAAILVVICGWFFGQHYYQNEYLLHIQEIRLENQRDMLTVQVLSETQEGLLYVVCTDSYGNSVTSPVVGGIATFTELHPGTRYSVRLEVNGFHKLVGPTSDSFTTAAQAQILSFTAGMGPEDCSVSLNFTVSGPDNGKWIVHYSADGVEPKSLAFTGRSVVVRNLEPGKKYTFTLFSDDGLYVSGNFVTEFVATNILYAQDLTIVSCGGGRLTATWQPTEDGNVQQWRVRCYNESGYDETILTTDLTHTFTGIDHSTACTVEVTAVGMPQGVSASISANPVNIVDFRCSFTEDMALQVQWLPVSQIPITDWVLRCRLDNGTELLVHSEESRVMLLALPGCVYSFTIETSDGNYVFNASHQYTADEVLPFTGYGISHTDLSEKLYLLPEGDKWTMADFPEGGSTDHLFLGQKGALVVMSGIQPEASDNNVLIRFVLHDGNGKLVGISEVTFVWNKMWKNGYCILPIPELPEVEGHYILTVYFDGMYALREDFSMLPSPVEEPEIQT